MKIWLAKLAAVSVVCLVFLAVGYKLGEVRVQAQVKQYHAVDIYAHNDSGVHIVSHDNGTTWFYVADGKPVPR